MPTDGGLTDLAATLADGQAVDWAALEAELGSDAERAIFRQLRVIAEIAELHRSIPEEASAPDEEMRGLLDSAPAAPQSPGPLPAAPSSLHDSTADAAVPPPEPDLGTWGPYRLLRTLGPGTLGHVVRATDHLHRDVVIRFLPVPCVPEVAVAFLATGQTLARIRHPNAVEVYGAEQHDDRTGLVMEFVDGRSLDAVVESQGTFSAREAALVGWELCRAIAALHREGVAHGLLAPDNIVREAGGRLVLMDVWPQGVPAECLALGPSTLPFIAPEVAAGGPPSTRADIYSLGVVLYYLVSGAHPVHAATIEELATRHGRRERTPLADLRPDLADDFIRIVERACEPDPERRFPTVGAVKEALSRTLGWDTWTRKHPVVSSTGGGDAVAAATQEITAGHAAAMGLATPVPPASAPRGLWSLVGIAVGAIAIGGLVAWTLLPRGAVWRGYSSSIATAGAAGGAASPAGATPIANLRLALGSATGADRSLTPLVIEQVAQDLSSSPFRVIATAAVEAMQGYPVPAIMQAVDADVFVQIGVTRRDRGLHAQVMLVRAGGPSHTFEEQTTAGTASRAFTATLSERILQEMAASEPASRPSLRTELPIDNPEAMQAYMIGRTRLGRGGKTDVEEAVTAFRAATEAEPDFVLAYAKWAEALLSLYRHNGLSADEALPLANQIISSALSIDDRSAEAYAALGDLHAERHNFEQSERYFKRALELSPSCEYARIRYAMLLAARGRVDDAVDQVEQAQKLNPRSSLLRGYLAATQHYAKRFEDAARTYETLLKLDEKYSAAYIGLCKAYTELRRTAQAIDACTTVGAQQAAEDPFVLSQFVKIHHDAGQEREAQASLRRLHAVYDARPTGDGAFWLALAYVSLGNNTRALEWLDRAIDANSSRLAYARVDSRLDPLRRDPRFMSRMARIQQGTSSVVEASDRVPGPPGTRR